MNAFDSFASTHICTSAPSWQDRLPLPLRADAAGLTWERFTAIHAPQNGPVRLGGWSVTALGAGRSSYEATLAVDSSIHTATAVANGPVAGMTALLHDLGIHLEILSFDQRDFGGTHATFLLCRQGERQTWAMGTGEIAAESTLRAIIAGANRLSVGR
jgi:hypothetical protein